MLLGLLKARFLNIASKRRLCLSNLACTLSLLSGTAYYMLYNTLGIKEAVS
jgi:hypothetical protein